MAASSNEPSLSPRGRLARWRSPVSRRTPSAGRRDDRPGGLTGRAQRPQPVRDALLRVFRSPLGPRAAEAVRGHRAIENSLHWVLDVTFGDDSSPVRRGHGAKNVAVVRHFAINLARTAKDKRSVSSAKMRRLGPDLPRDNPGTAAALTWIRSPGREAPPIVTRGRTQFASNASS
jgi:hypothetical protein